MAFYNEEYSNICKEWISNNQVFYNNKIDVAKRTIKVGGLLHMYQLAIENMPANPLLSKAGEYGNVVKKYHKSIHSTFGVKALMSQDNYLSLITMSNKDVVLFSTSWLIHGDFYENLVYQIIDSYNDSGFKKKELSLYDLKKRIISESIFLGIKSLEDWQKYDRDMKEIKGWTILPDDFEVPHSIKQEDTKEMPPAPIILPQNTKGIDKKKTKHIAQQKPQKERTNFYGILNVKDDIQKSKIIKAIAEEIKSNNTGERIAFIKMALTKDQMIDTELPFLPFYNAMAESIREFLGDKKLISRKRCSDIYHSSQSLLNRNETNCINEEEREKLKELDRICNILKTVGKNDTISNE